MTDEIETIDMTGGCPQCGSSWGSCPRTCTAPHPWGGPQGPKPAPPPDEIETMRALLEGATPGPWVVTESGDDPDGFGTWYTIGSAHDTSIEATICNVEPPCNHSEHDGALILAMRNTGKAALAVIAAADALHLAVCDGEDFSGVEFILGEALDAWRAAVREELDKG